MHTTRPCTARSTGTYIIAVQAGGGTPSANVPSTSVAPRQLTPLPKPRRASDGTNLPSTPTPRTRPRVGNYVTVGEELVDGQPIKPGEYMTADSRHGQMLSAVNPRVASVRSGMTWPGPAGVGGILRCWGLPAVARRAAILARSCHEWRETPWDASGHVETNCAAWREGRGVDVGLNSRVDIGSPVRFALMGKPGNRDDVVRVSTCCARVGEAVSRVR